jgi:hypothetical protein
LEATTEQLDKASEAILALKPVTFHYKSDKQNALQFGLIAEEVAEVNPDLVARDAGGKAFYRALGSKSKGLLRVCRR